MADEIPGRRRRPSQERSQATVGFILEATTQLLRQGDASSLTTQAIADRAGVSIGSVYRYFEDRDALLRALLERRRQAQMEALLAAFTGARAWSIRELAGQLVGALFPMLVEDEPLHRALNREMLRLRGVEGVIGSELDFSAALVPFLEARSGELREGLDPSTAAWLVVHTVSSARLAWVMTDRLQSELEAERLMDGLTRMVTRYVCPDDG